MSYGLLSSILVCEYLSGRLCSNRWARSKESANKYVVIIMWERFFFRFRNNCNANMLISMRVFLMEFVVVLSICQMMMLTFQTVYM